MSMLICVICGVKYGKPKSKYATYYQGKCDYCGEETNVTEARDYGHPEVPKSDFNYDEWYKNYLEYKKDTRHFG